MARHSASRGFTLIELLTVIGIIAILAGILIPTVNVAIQKAKVARSQQEVDAIAVAVRSYFDEYSRWPEVPGSGNRPANGWSEKAGLNRFTDLRHATNVNAYTMAVLTGIDKIRNPKGIEFIAIKEQSRQPTSSSLKIPGSSESIDWFFADAWGRPYFVAIDLDYSYDSTVRADLQEPPFHNTSAVDVYSAGPDVELLDDRDFQHEGAGTQEGALNNW